MEQKMEKNFFVFMITENEKGNFKFSQYQTGYLSSTVNVLTKPPKISNFNKGDIFRVISLQSDPKLW